MTLLLGALLKCFAPINVGRVQARSQEFWKGRGANNSHVSTFDCFRSIIHETCIFLALFKK